MSHPQAALPDDHPVSLRQRLGLPRYARFSPKKTARDIANFARYGPAALRCDETIWVNPQRVHWQMRPPQPIRSLHTRPYWSGTILGGDWDQCVFDLTTTSKYKACVARFKEGLTWEETGIYDRMMVAVNKFGTFDGCATLDDLKKRYTALDRLWETINAEQRLRRQRDLPTFKRGEFGGVFGHITRDGDFIRVHNGNHRFAMARLAGLQSIPVHVGLVHPDAVRSGAIKRLRRGAADIQRWDT